MFLILQIIVIEAEGPPCDKSHEPKKPVPTKPENKPGSLKFLSEEENLKVRKILFYYSIKKTGRRLASKLTLRLSRKVQTTLG